jgi:hypothetical protein
VNFLKEAWDLLNLVQYDRFGLTTAGDHISKPFRTGEIFPKNLLIKQINIDGIRVILPEPSRLSGASRSSSPWEQ